VGLQHTNRRIQSLSALKSLSIYGCPELEKRCKMETGEDWPKISHIQNLQGMFWISRPFLSTCGSICALECIVCLRVYAKNVFSVLLLGLKPKFALIIFLTDL